MQSKIRVRICTGTACFVMGSSDILLLEEILPEHLKEMVSIEGTMCLDICTNDVSSKPPYVTVNDHLITRATPHKVINYIESLIEKE